MFYDKVAGTWNWLPNSS